MEDVLNNASVKRVIGELEKLNIAGEVKILSESARSAAEAAAALGIEVGQIASSIVFKLPDGRPLQQRLFKCGKSCRKSSALTTGTLFTLQKRGVRSVCCS